MMLDLTNDPFRNHMVIQFTVQGYMKQTEQTLNKLDNTSGEINGNRDLVCNCNLRAPLEKWVGTEEGAKSALL